MLSLGASISLLLADPATGGLILTTVKSEGAFADGSLTADRTFVALLHGSIGIHGLHVTGLRAALRAAA